jgi:hypothetical protein
MAFEFPTEKWMEVLKQYDAQTKRKLSHDSKWMNDVLQVLKKNQFETVEDLDGVTFDLLAFTTNDADEEIPALQKAAFKRIMAEYNRVKGTNGSTSNAGGEISKNTTAVSDVGVVGTDVNGRFNGRTHGRPRDGLGCTRAVTTEPGGWGGWVGGGGWANK